MAKEQWRIYGKKADFEGIARKYHLDPVTAWVMRNRDVVGDEAIEEFLFGDVGQMNSPFLMKGVREACRILMEKIEAGKRIRIIGDYDSDGVNSTYILFHALGRLGARVDYEIPDRMTDGYGMNPRMAADAAKDGIDTILTCDNGIAAVQAVREAKEMGLTVIVTDHHDIPDEVPKADVIINPKQEDCGYPFKGICGAVVAYKLMEALLVSYEIPRKEAYPYLEYAAIATVTDVMELKGENRIIVKEGLKRLKKTTNKGLLHLMAACGIEAENLTAYHLGFIIGPCLNAGGRLKTARLPLELLLSQDSGRAAELAVKLKELNDERKILTEKGAEEACQIIESSSLDQDKVLVVYLPECHESIAGIIAGRIKEKYHKPSIVLTGAKEGAKGSGRSIEAYHMFEGLKGCSQYLTKFGGHPMAAGMSLEVDKIEPFRRALNEQACLEEKDFVKTVWIDLVMPFSHISEYLVEDLKKLEPYGVANPKPLFAAKNVEIGRMDILGKSRKIMKFKLKDSLGTWMDGVCFLDPQEFLSKVRDRYGDSRADLLAAGMETGITFSICYYPDVNEFRGNRTVQVVVQNYMF